MGYKGIIDLVIGRFTDYDKIEKAKIELDIPLFKKAIQHWKDGDYKVAILPKREDDIIEGYILGYHDGYQDALKGLENDR